MKTSNKSNKKSTALVVVETAPVVDTNVAEVLAEATVQLAENNEVVATVEHVLTKADIGRTIFEQELAKEGGLVRKDTIARLINEAGLTPKGAATYFQNMKKKAGLVHAKA